MIKNFVNLLLIKMAEVYIFFEDQTYEICTLAIQQIGYALEYVKKQTEEICKLAF